MKLSISSAILVAASASTAYADAVLINGNWYGKAVDQIDYTGWDETGTYNRVTDMDNGQCETEPVSYSGGMSPLNEEVSWHFRGPMHLKQFAFYTPGSSSSKRDIRPNASQRGYANDHRRHVRQLGVEVTAVINGATVSWINSYAGPTDSISESTATASNLPQSESASSGSMTTSSWASQSATKSPAPAVNAGSGNWGRQAYYGATDNTSNGLVFLNNMGGQVSGVFDYVWGNSLSYASADAKSGSASPQILADVLIDDNNEFSIFTDESCVGDSCGYSRPGTVAYHGFSGNSKLFLLELDMPLSGKTGSQNADMPAVWMLNALIPRTQQYGNCSCWSTGCGEWDILEILDSGNTMLKSTLHAGQSSGGPNDYFVRPTTTTAKYAIIFDGNDSKGQIMLLPNTTIFESVLTGDTVTGWGNISTGVGLASKFVLASSGS